MLFSERLSGVGSDWDAGFGFDIVRLAVLSAEKLDESQIDFSGEGASGPDFERLVDRLGARLGPARITRFVPVDSHIPERATRAQVVAESAQVLAWEMPDESGETPPDRPLRLFSRPERIEVMATVPEGPPIRFRWRRVDYKVARAEGPERIAPEWWRPGDAEALTRDYFRVEDSDGRRFWLYRSGLYGREAEHPAWYMHGLFA
jgi:protein ImuB